MFDILTLSLAVVVFFGPLVSAISFGVRGYQQANQRGTNPMPFIMFYSLLGIIIGGVIVTIILILTEGIILNKNVSLKERICLYYTGGIDNNNVCSKYTRQ